MAQPKNKSLFKNESAIPLSLETHWFIGPSLRFPYPALRQLSTILNADYAWECTPSASLDGSMDHTFLHRRRGMGRRGIRCPSPRAQRGNNQDPRTLELGLAQRDNERRGKEHIHPASSYHHIHKPKPRCEGGRSPAGIGMTLAYKALEHAGKKALQQSREPTVLSTGRTHGRLIFEWHASADYPITYESGILQHVPITSIRPGDILELADGRFRTTCLALASLVRQEENVRFNAHTAVIVGLKLEESKLIVIEQNGRARSIVAENEYILLDMVSGTVQIYRPIGTSLASSTSTLYDAVSLTGICEKW
ncbi:hypothetical protein MGYG_07239 [Nannizzia gypsea CBS 118893]|uniref:BBC1/AIM3 cysteine proteinase-fold domain-containing protein n=1 Tax=Arthroderma gypseum (strain ATCC MYA-4604 / CBS 118893) TaxID=535722 RepID=E4V2G7_ARTGP|nr:hypothetical protein MGYG_07239 [Nannizzia gypsea CBS 118893]EFR04232.1 hypothetical protein MGYG_07239 [Nannizzia gypsea CBS 118893]